MPPPTPDSPSTAPSAPAPLAGEPRAGAEIEIDYRKVFAPVFDFVPTPQDPVPPAPILPPAPAPERYGAMDALRGFSLFGILPVNMFYFANADALARNPVAVGPISDADFAVWTAVSVFFQGKFIALFSMLFGAGIVLMTDRVEARQSSPTEFHMRRMFALFCIGMVHAYLIWFGDVLVTYAICGCFAFVARKWQTEDLIVAGIITLTLDAVVYHNVWSVYYAIMELLSRAGIYTWQPDSISIPREIAAYLGTWREQVAYRAPMVLKYQTLGFAYYLFLRTLGLMLVGMGLQKTGLFKGEWKTANYAKLALFCAFAQLPGIWTGMLMVESNWEEGATRDFGLAYHYMAPFVTLSYTAMLMLVWRSGALRFVTDRLAAVGRMALTNYLMQSVICTTIFYGHGFGYFGHSNRIFQANIIVCIWLFQLLYSPIWLRFFRFGPMEWVWRTMTYLRWQPMLKRAS